MNDDLEFTIKASPQLIEAIANKVIEKTNPNKLETSNLVYTVKQVAKMLGKTQQTIANHIRKDLLIANKTGKSYTITESNLKLYINGNK